MIRFIVQQHTIRNVEIVEVHDDKGFVATITPAEEREGSGFRIVSRRIECKEMPGMLTDETVVWQFTRKPQ